MSNTTTVAATTIGGALGIIVVWIVSGPVGVDVPVYVGAAISTLFTAVAGLVFH